MPVENKSINLNRFLKVCKSSIIGCLADALSPVSVWDLAPPLVFSLFLFSLMVVK